MKGEFWCISICYKLLYISMQEEEGFLLPSNTSTNKKPPQLQTLTLFQ